MAHTRLNKDRYAVHGEWRHRASRSGLVDHGTVVKPAAIEVSSADLAEKTILGDYVWTNGAFRVKLQHVPDMRSKQFYGETAWMDAARYASDAAQKCGWNWWPDL